MTVKAILNVNTRSMFYLDDGSVVYINLTHSENCLLTRFLDKHRLNPKLHSWGWFVHQMIHETYSYYAEKWIIQ